MRRVRMMFLAGAALSAHPAFAADALKFGPPPGWVVPQTVPTRASKAANAPAALLLNDEQVKVEPGKTTSYAELAVKLQSADGLSAGNLTLPWNPAFDTVTVNKVHIIRGDKIIDVLGAGQTFTVARRETNLDAAMIDGTLTAALQPEDLQVGDIVDFAVTIEHSDPTLKNHVEGEFAGWNGLPVELGHVRISWPETMKVVTQESDGVPAARRFTDSGQEILELSGHAVEPLVPPSSAPIRYQIGRLGELSDFQSWGGLSDLFRPLYEAAAVVPPSGPLRNEVENIRKQAHGAKEQAELALQLVENRVRYVALSMGTGGLVPASAETTWARRFGDCKAKTALLLAILHDLGIQAEPVLAHHSLGDVLADRLPMVGDFDHVFVRAHVGSKDYWLDGTRTGDTDLDSIRVPDFGWVLPLTAKAQLVHLVPPPLDIPDSLTVLEVDATGGVYAPAAATAEQTITGDLAVAYNTRLSALSPAQQQDFYRTFWNSLFDFVTLKNGAFSFDKDKHQLHLTMTGEAKLDWAGSYLHVPRSSVGYRPDFDRPQGPLQRVPFTVEYPSYVKTVIRLHMPPSFVDGRKLGSADVHETIAGVEYNRSASIAGTTVTVETSARSVVPEISYQEAKAAEPRLIALNDEDVDLPLPGTYQMTDADLDAMRKLEPASANELVTRGNTFLDYKRYDDALADFTKALSIDPKNVTALADRGLVYFYKKDVTSAQKDLDAAQAIDPFNAIVFRGRALIADDKGDITGAIDDYSKSLEREPTNRFALFRRSQLYLENQQYSLARNDMSKILASDPKNVAALAQRASIDIASGDYASAKGDISAAKSIAPDDSSVLEMEARLATVEGDSKSALAAYSRMVETGKDKATALAKRAQAYQGLSRFAEALADTDAAMKLGDTDVAVHLTRANIFKRQDKPDAVAAEAEAMTRDNPKSTLAFVAAGRAYGAIDRRDKAMEAFTNALAIKPEAYIYLNREAVRPRSDLAGRMADVDAALKLEPDNSIALSDKAQLLSDGGDYSGALAVLDRLPNRETDDAREQRAVVLYKAGRAAEGDKLLQSLEASAKTAHQLNALCWTEATAGILLDHALQECRGAVKLNPESGSYLDSLGLVLLKLGKLDEAIDVYGRAIAKGVGSSSLMGRAIAYLRKGDPAHGATDAAAARKLSSTIDDEFAGYGLKFDQGSAKVSSHANTAPSAN